MKFTISCLLILLMRRTKFGLDRPSNSEEVDVNARRTTYDDGHQPIATSHLSDSNVKQTEALFDKEYNNIHVYIF